MKKRFLVAASAMFYMHAQASTQAVVDTSFFAQLVQNKFAFFLEKDTAKLNKIIHPSCKYIHSSGLIDTKESLYKSLFKSKNPYTGFLVSNTVVRSINKLTVIVNAVVEVSYVNTEANSKLLVTEVYTKQRKKWLLISRHANKLIK